MSDSPYIRVEGLSRFFKKGPHVINVLDSLNLDIRRGESVGIIGASGSGKSTLLHLLGGLDRPQSGSIYYGDKDICKADDKELALFRNLKIGFVFQFHYLLPEFNTLENVMMPSLLSSARLPDTRERARDLLEIVGLGNRLDHKPGELAGGEQQRVAVARALMMSPDVLLADEPTGDLDPATGEKIIELFCRLKESMGITMVIATHNMELTKTMDRIMLLRRGRLESYRM